MIILSHFDILGAIAFKDLQNHAKDCRALDSIPEGELLTDLYAMDRQGTLFAGIDTYTRILPRWFILPRWLGSSDFPAFIQIAKISLPPHRRQPHPPALR